MARGSLAAGAALTGVVAAIVPLSARAEGPPPQVLYLDFSDGSETVVQGMRDEAADGVSAIGGAAPYPAFDWTHLGAADRDAVVQEVATRVGEAFRPYNVLVTTTRPPQRGYSTVIIGGGPAVLALPPPVAGVALLDCDNREPGNVAFAFSDNLGDSHALWVTIAQEAAHTFGLEHTDDDRDVMYPRSVPSQTGFLEEEAQVVAPICGPLLQSSARRLREVLGVWEGAPDKPLVAAMGELQALPPSEADAGGCAVAPLPRARAAQAGGTGGRASRFPFWGLSLALLFVRSRLARGGRAAYKVRSRG